MDQPAKAVLTILSDNGPRINRGKIFEGIFDEIAESNAATTVKKPWAVDKPISASASNMEWEMTVSLRSLDFPPLLCSESSDTSVSSGSKGPRVHFVATGPSDQDVLRTEYESNVDYDTIRSKWFTVADFKAFRKECQEAAARASRDGVYCKHFFDIYASCFNDQEAKQKSTLDFSDYRGLERAVFRQPLITDKIAVIKGVVRAQANGTHDEELGNLCMRYTATARKMARFLAKFDRVVADQPTSPKSLIRPRRFIEI